MRAGSFPRPGALALLLAACAPGEPPEPPPAEAPPAAAAPAPAPAAFVQRDVCPFECCVYGEWKALNPIAVYAAEGDTTRIAFTLAAGERFRAATGNVHLAPTGLAVALDSVPLEVVDGGGPLTLEPGDTVEILAPVGEGYHYLRVGGRIVQAYGFWDAWTSGPGGPSGRLVREPEFEWWARVEHPRGSGWIAMHATDGDIWGVDACGGPEPA